MAENENKPIEDEQVEATPPAEEPEAEATPEAEPEAASEPEAAPEPEQAPEPEAASEPEQAPEPETEPEAAPEPEAASEPEQAPEPAAPPQPEKPSRSRRHVPRSQRRKRTAKVRAVAKPAKKGERTPIVRLPKPEGERGRRQERRGVVVSSAMDKTVVVKVDTIKAHRKYGKVVRRSKKFHAHDEANAAKVGDVVRIVETRPISASKRWRVVEVVEVAK